MFYNCENQKCSLGPKMQNKPYFFLTGMGFPKCGGGVPNLEKIPTFSRFWWQTSLMCVDICEFVLLPIKM